jgi:hypothetical protein
LYPPSFHVTGAIKIGGQQVCFVYKMWIFKTVSAQSGVTATTVMQDLPGCRKQASAEVPVLLAAKLRCRK